MSDTTTATDDTTTEAPHVESEDSFEQLLSEGGRVLVDFYADWCSPCQLIAPTIDDLAAESDATVVKLNAETLPQIAAQYDVSSVPTFLVFDDGELDTRLVDIKEKKTLESAIQ